MKRDNGTYCDSPKCHLIIAPNDKEALHYGKTDYHGHCYLSVRRQLNLRVSTLMPPQMKV